MYYINFFMARFILILLVLFSGRTSSIALWSIMLGVEVVFVFSNFFKIYESLQTRIISFLTEVSVLVVVIYCFICNFRNGDS